MATTEFDVVVAGGGMVGAATALAMAVGGVRVAVVEPSPPAAWNPQVTGQRVSSLTVASRRLLGRLGVWDDIAARRLSPFEAIHAWDEDAHVHFEAASVGQPLLGWIVENALVQEALLARCRERAEIRLCVPGAIAGWNAEGNSLLVRLADGDRLRTRLLVAADGASSGVRQQAGIDVSRHDYGQQGVVSTVTTARHHGAVARQRFLPTGPLALLPLADGRSSLVWSADNACAEALLAMDDAAFATALEDASDGVLGEVVAVSPRAAFPLGAQHADRYIGERLALVGDAAHVIHPLAGQGANLGLLDAAALAEVVSTARATGRDVGAHPVLRRYKRWRAGDNRRMQRVMDGFHWLFANRDPLRGSVRRMGFRLTDRSERAKMLFMRHAMGLAGELPALMRTPVADDR